VTARLVMSQARGLWRGDKPVEAIEAFKRAIEMGEPLGDEAYEAYTTSMSLGSSAAAALGQFALSEAWSDRILRVCEEHGDIVGICYALINRSTLSFLTDQIDRLLVDLERAVQISREFGMPLAESMCVRDLGEIYLSLGKPVEGEPYIRRAHAMYTQAFGEMAARSINCEVQLARLKWWSGDVATAEEIFRKVTAQQAAALAAGQSDSILTGSERLALDQVGTAVGAGSSAEFDALIARGHELALQPQDVVELVEWKGLAALRAGRRDEAIPLFEQALALAEKSARLVSDRVRRQLIAATREPSAPVSMEG